MAHRFFKTVAILGIAQLTAGCGDTGAPASGGATGNSAAGQNTTGGAAGAPGGGSGGAAAGSSSTGGGGSAGDAGRGGMGGSVVAPVIPGGPDESIPADPGEQPFIHPLFTDHMVLQRDAHTPVWGWTTPGTAVTINIHGETFTARADQYGRWLTRIGPFPADGIAYELEISGPQNVKFTDVKFGDVWLCSGQSNMEFVVDGVINKDAELAASDNPDIRLFHVARVNLGQPKQTFGKAGSGPWAVVGPESVRYFSAVCYFMVKKLQSELKVPMGMIGSYWGATKVEWWTSRKKLATVEDFAHPLENLAPDAVVDPDQPQNTTLYNGMIAPLLPYGLKGIAWYQGESNWDNGWQYSRLMPNMIEDWRAGFRMGKLPFFQVQLAGFRANGGAPVGPFDAGSSWAVLREAQERTRLNDDKGGMAVTLDIGNPTDIHPTDKQDVGLRLAASALHVAYGQDNVYEGPTFKSFTVQGNKVVVTFDLVGDGLMLGTKDGTNTNPVVENAGGTLTGFALAGADKQWKVASAVIDPGGKTVTVTSAEVAAPVAVRYGWHDDPGCNLYNKAGLMASSFRTDPDYRVSVIDGSGGGNYDAGKMVTVTANPPPGGQHFVKWVGDVQALDDANKSPATLTMPKAYVSIRASYAQ